MTEPLDARSAEIAFIIPCLNEAATIGALVRGLHAFVPGARVLVFDNMSEDETAAQATAAGAEVFRVPLRGKGHVIRTAFADVDADIYVMIDGDGTYDPEDAPALIRALIEHRLDMVIGQRRGIRLDAGRYGHALGNRLFNRLFSLMFGRGLEDIFSGYRVFSRRFVKSFPAFSSGFEIETELSVHSLMLRMPIMEIPVHYGRRHAASRSKLSASRDGLRILAMFFLLMKEARPFLFFGSLAAATATVSVVLAIPVLGEYFATGFVARTPTWTLSIGLLTIATLMFFCGIILDSVARGRQEQKKLAALQEPRLHAEPEKLPCRELPSAPDVMKS